jgi:hypothetical protein
VCDDKEEVKGFVLPKWFTPVITSGFIAAVSVAFQMYTDLALVRQELAGESRARERRYAYVDSRLDKQDERIAHMEQGQEKLYRDAGEKLDIIVSRLRK